MNKLCKVCNRSFFSWEPELLSRKLVLKLNKSPITCYEIVADMDKYPEFVPWINSVSTKHKSESYAVATMTIGFPPVTQTYNSYVTFTYPEKILSTSNNTPVFAKLESLWEFFPDKESLHQEGSVVKVDRCEAHYSVKFKFASAFYQHLSGVVLDQVCTVSAKSFTNKINSVPYNNEVLYNKEKHHYEFSK